MSLNDNTPVIAEWYVHKFIPSIRHVAIVPYRTAKEWQKQYPKLGIKLIDPSLYHDMVAGGMVIKR